MTVAHSAIRNGLVIVGQVGAYKDSKLNRFVAPLMAGNNHTTILATVSHTLLCTRLCWSPSADPACVSGYQQARARVDVSRLMRISARTQVSTDAEDVLDSLNTLRR